MGVRRRGDRLSGRVLTWFDPAPEERKEELWLARLSSPLWRYGGKQVCCPQWGESHLSFCSSQD